jgi:integrase/recombinase XerD
VGQPEWEHPMTFVPSLLRSASGSGPHAITLGHPMLDDYLAFVAARARPNTWLAAAFDLKVFSRSLPRNPLT